MKTAGILVAIGLTVSISSAIAYAQPATSSAVSAPANELTLACYLSKIDPSKYRSERNLNEITTGDYYLLGIGLSPFSESSGDLTVRLYDPNGLIDAEVEDAKKASGFNLGVVNFKGANGAGRVLTLTRDPAISNNYVGLLIPRETGTDDFGYTGMCGGNFRLTRATFFESLQDLLPTSRRLS